MSSNPLSLIVDLQGFQCGRNGDFIVKELAAVCLLSGRHTHILFKPPKPFRKLSRRVQSQCRWLERNYLGGLRWSDGYADLSMLPLLLRKLLISCKTMNKKKENNSSMKDADSDWMDHIYVLCKGSEKKTILQSYLNQNNDDTDTDFIATVINVDDYQAYVPDIESFHTLQCSDVPTCLFHNYQNINTHCALKNVWYLYNILSRYNLNSIL